ncbi:hypothetical protein K1719_039019 [Acacia pycnantha]|nr:hypothetical protein K1719_044180 [Acacia pycnantha]KAI9079019.1 hypothetical protein K1719_039019 [Acacia pycnantha]
MKQMLMDGAAPFLPEEIITQILKRLPVKSLMRFQCVCKLWKNLFKKPSFIADQLCHSSNQNPSFLFWKNSGTLFHLRLLDCEMQISDVQEAPLFDFLKSSYVKIIGSCNGLLCLQISYSFTSPPSFLLWNPATRDFREVPTSRTIDPRVYKHVLGFGFSAFVNDYKILRIFIDSSNMIYKVEVYSLSKDSWKEIKFENLEYEILFGLNVSSNGRIFWYGLKAGEEQGEWDRVLISFDIRMEVFTLIPWPALSRNSGVNLTVYENKLAIIAVYGSKGSFYIDLWVLEDKVSFGERWSWIKKFTSGPCPWKLDFGTIWRNEIVISWSEIEHEIEKNEPKRGLCLFNVTTDEFKMLAVPQDRPGWELNFIYVENHFLTYVESLVPVVNIHNIEEA